MEDESRLQCSRHKRDIISYLSTEDEGDSQNIPRGGVFRKISPPLMIFF